MLYDWGMVKIYHRGTAALPESGHPGAGGRGCREANRGWFRRKGTAPVGLAGHQPFLLPLWGQLLKECGLFPLHAAGLVKEGRSCLFLGRSGSGKSTLTLHLVKNGYGLLSDDTVFLREKDGGG